MLSEIDQIVHKEIDLQGPGVAIAVVKNGKMIHSAGYGFANLEWSCPIQPDFIKDCLLPMSEETYYTSEDNEFEVHFSEEKAGVFHALTLHLPVYRTFNAIRKQA
jgi:hypothetical protein